MSPDTQDPEIFATDPRDALARLIHHDGWKAVGAGYVARDDKRPIHVPGGTVRAGYKAALAGSYADAVTTAQTLRCDDPGLGVVLGDRCDGHVLAALDQDHVADAATGIFAPWALELAKLLPTYTEISKSRTGLHSIFWLTAEGAARLRAIIATQKRPGSSLDSVTWPHPGGKAKAELYLGLRYIALTGWRLPGFPDGPAAIDPEVFT